MPSRTRPARSVRLVRALLLATLAAPRLVSAQDAPTALADRVEITFLDVGQADAVVIRGPDGISAMIDAGRSSPLRYLQRMGIDSLALLVASHPHADHIGGLDDVLTARPVRWFLDSGSPHTTDTYLQLISTLDHLGDVQYLEAVPRTITLGQVVVEVLPLPPPEYPHTDRSVGLVVTFGEFSAFFSGDSERRELDFWTDAGVVPDVTLLKAPHHGAANGFTRAFLDAARPEVVVISVGRDNAYQHPRPEALAAYGGVAAQILRTDRDGDVTVFGYADGRYDVVTATDVEPVVGAPSVGPGADGDARPAGGAAAADRTDRSAVGEPVVVTVSPRAVGLPHETLNDEYVAIRNPADSVLAIGNWRVCDLSTRCFRFPPDARVEPNDRVVVFTGYGTSDGVSFFMNNDRAVWNDNGDEAIVLDAQGNRVTRHVYE